MTLAELLPAVRELPAVDKLRLLRILADELDSGEEVSPLVPHKVYHLATPYGISGAGRALADAMKTPDRNQG